jgi:N-acetylmuramoyl-L-alanine amidase
MRLAILTVALLALTACGDAEPAAPRGADALVVPVEPAAAPLQASIDPAPAAPAPAAPVVAEQPVRARKVVVLDPGHGGDEVGSANNGVVEKHSNLDFALRVEQLLLARDVDVHLTRRTDTRASATIPGFTPTRSDLQARLDGANAAGGDVFVSIHSNGSTDPGQNGVEAWYDSSWVYADEARRLAGLLVSHVLAELRRYGYNAQDRGLPDGRCFRQREGRCFTLFVIAGPRETSREEVMRRGGDPAQLGFGDSPSIYSRPAAMPAALVELLFTTYARDAAVLRDEAGRQAMARGVANAILVFLGLQDGT